MLVFMKGNEKKERESRKKAEKEALDKAKKEEETREAKRAARKLNFLITQTELYSHFIGNKIKSESLSSVHLPPSRSLTVSPCPSQRAKPKILRTLMGLLPHPHLRRVPLSLPPLQLATLLRGASSRILISTLVSSSDHPTTPSY